MSTSTIGSRWALLGLAMLLFSKTSFGQDSVPPAQDHSAHGGASSWMFMHDGVVFGTFNRQGSPRGETQFRSQNWLMLMASRPFGKTTLSLSGMFTAEPATLTTRGYSLLFQTGEAYKGLENTDRQHPHDLFMQLAASLQVPLGDNSHLTLSGALVGEPTLGPVAFMHRASAAENPSAPLSHHTMDSSHITSGVAAAGIDKGPVVVEGSVFHGRESDEHRWNLETGKLDSAAGRVWFKPSKSWLAQVSYGFINEPEELTPGDVRRTSASLHWLRESPGRITALSGAFGHNKRQYSDTSAYLFEATVKRGAQSFYTRAEYLQLETEHLLFPTVVHRPHPRELVDWLGALTLGVVRDLSTNEAKTAFGIGADVGSFIVPARLKPIYGAHPVSFRIFLRIRPPAGHMGRMWNMTMTQAISSHAK